MLSPQQRSRHRSTSEGDKESHATPPGGGKYMRERRVTFADIEELHMKYGPESDITEEGISTTIGYINRNCAEHYQDDNNNNAKDNVCDLKNQINWISEYVGHNILNKETTYDRRVQTIGKKGKQIGEYEDATHITYLPNDHIIVTDLINNRLHRLNSLGQIVTVYSGVDIAEPVSTCMTNDGHIALTSRRRKCVLIISLTGELLWSFGSGFFQSPSGVCVDKTGRFVVTDTGLDRVSLHSSAGQFLKYIGHRQIKERGFCRPRYVCVAPRGEIIVSDSGNNAIKIFDSNGNFIRSVGKFGKDDGHMKTPYGVCTDKFGHILVADHYNSRVSLYTTDGQFVCHVISKDEGILHPQGVALSPDLNLFVSHGHLKACEIKSFKLRNRPIDPTVEIRV